MNKKCLVYVYDSEAIEIGNLDFSWLPKDVLTYLESKKNNPKLYQSKIAWYYLCKALSEDLNYNLDQLEFNLINHQKPLIEGINFSISHSNNIIVFCIGDDPCSIDVELQKARDYSRLSKVSADFSENSINPQTEFYKMWCVKECSIKLGEDVKDFNFSFYEIKDLNAKAFMLCICSKNVIKIKSSLTITC